MTKQKDHYSVVIPTNVFPLPSQREMSTAKILCAYFRKNVTIIATSNQKTPDFRIGNVLWELKTPIGNGKYNIQHLLRKAITQSENIIIDARFSKMHITKITNELSYQYKHTSKIKRLIMINKQRQIIEFKR